MENVDRSTQKDRLRTLRPAPNMTLGGKVRKEFTPTVPRVPSVPQAVPSKPEIKPIVPKEQKHDNKQRHPKREFKPRQQNKKQEIRKDSQPKDDSVEPLELDTLDLNEYKTLDRPQRLKKKSKKYLELDPYNVDHPTTLPFTEYTAVGAEYRRRRDPYLSSFIKEDELCLIQLPSLLPIEEKPKEKEKEKDPKKKVEVKSDDWASEFENNLLNLPEGQIGRVLIYKSGKVVWKIGDFEYELKPGTQANFLQQVIAFDQQAATCYELGDLASRLICVPTIETLLQSNSS
eukprot:TRINITY_DN2974_c0_g1_i1.p1 TRINITY_DN2974_c0_g1~~TRINITY_DN2974_c0_g1_i1.p1  ORF type:complete len:299 (-),score=62.93 TRINITY_DN2974_c0_g1_i1:139-1002(-)